MGASFFQAEDGIRDVERSRGLGDVYKRQVISQSEDSLRLGITFLSCILERSLYLIFVWGFIRSFSSDLREPLVVI